MRREPTPGFRYVRDRETIYGYSVPTITTRPVKITTTIVIPATAMKTSTLDTPPLLSAAGWRVGGCCICAWA